MAPRQVIPARLELRLGNRRISIFQDDALTIGGLLTAAHAKTLLERGERPRFIVADEADAAALADLRRARVSYAVLATGETFVTKPQAARLRESHFESSGTGRRNPFAPRASRVPRWLLLHAEAAFTIRELSYLVDIDESLVSRTVSSLQAEGYVMVSKAPDDDRVKNVSLESPLALLLEWSAVWRRRRPPARRFDIGTRSVAETLRVISDSSTASVPYAVSGLAGAQALQRAVEPSDVLLLTTTNGAHWWSDRLLAEPSPSAGLLRIASLPDDFVFRLTHEYEGVLIADPVQLWLDNAISGERALAASDAIAQRMSWSR